MDAYVDAYVTVDLAIDCLMSVYTILVLFAPKVVIG